MKHDTIVKMRIQGMCSIISNPGKYDKHGKLMATITRQNCNVVPEVREIKCIAMESPEPLLNSPG